MQHSISGGQLIGFSESRAGQSHFSSHNPDTGEPNPWTFKEATAEEIQQAMQKAAAAFPVYACLSGTDRARFLNAIADGLEAGADALAGYYTAESGLPEGRARGELGRTVGQLRMFADVAARGAWVNAQIDTANPERTPVPKPDLRKCLVPMGPVVVFGASNFPLAFSTAGGDTASALAAGCPVVVKGHPLHPATGEFVARTIQKAARETGMPEGTFSHLQGTSHALGEQLVLHPATAAVGFTGSQVGGLALARLAQQREVPIPVFSEMGSINPVLLFPSALASEAGWAQSYAQSVTLGTGQFCTNPGLLIGLEGPALDVFCDGLATAMAAVPQSCMLNKGISARYESLRRELLVQHGVKEITAPSAGGGVNRVPATVARVSGVHFLGNKTLQEEVFGPFTLVVGCADAHQMEQVLASLEGQLTGSVIGNPSEFDAHRSAISALQRKVGRLLFNGVPTGVEVCNAMHHGGPFPATTDARFTSVGADAILRWARPVSYQNAPDALLPPALQNANPLGIWRAVNGNVSQESL